MAGKRIKRKPRYTIAVTGLNAIDSPGPGVAVIRAIRDCPDFDARIIGLSYDALEPGIYMSGIADKTYQIPYPSAGSAALRARLRDIHRREKLDLVIPNFDAELFNFMKISDALRRDGVRSFLPTVKQFEARDKLNLSAFGKMHSFHVPADMVIHTVQSLPAAAEKLGYPLVVKGKYYDATVAKNLEQAQSAFYKIQAKWGLPVIVQQFVSGEEINIAGLGDGSGNAVSIIPMRKLYITDKGKAWAGITLEDDILIELANRFIRATNWRGGFELEVMRAKDGTPYIMEVNPRFPAWIYLSAGAGQNQPAALVKLAMGTPVKPYTHYTAGTMFIRYAWDLIVGIERFQTISTMGELTLTEKDDHATIALRTAGH